MQLGLCMMPVLRPRAHPHPQQDGRGIYLQILAMTLGSGDSVRVR